MNRRLNPEARAEAAAEARAEMRIRDGKITCPRCGLYAKVAKSGPHTGMVCEDCAAAEEHEADVERDGSPS